MTNEVVTKKPHIVHSATEAINLTQDYIERQNELYTQDDVGVPFGVEIVDNFAKTTRRGQLVSFMARPANGKTFLMQMGFQNAMQRLIDKGITNRLCVWVSYEESLEDFVSGILAHNTGHSIGDILDGRVKLAQIGKMAIIKVATLPFIFVGHSDEKDETGRTKRPRMTMKILNEALDYIRYAYLDPVTGTNCEFELICLDYLQRMHKENSAIQNTPHFEECVNWAKDTAKWAACPFWLAVQASRKVDQYKIKLATWDDGQNTSNIEQTSDVIIASWMPKNHKLEFQNELVPSFGDLPELKITDNLMYFSLLKQKKAKAPKTWALYVRPDLLQAREFKS